MTVHFSDIDSCQAPAQRVSRFLAALDFNPAHARSVRAIRRQRSRRGEIFGSNLFTDPAWDILLVLYLAHLEQRRIAVNRLCRACGVPATTGLRWIGVLHSKGFIERNRDPLDARRVYISLSPKGLAAMNRYIAHVPAVLQGV